jgi:hypothetical protein
MKHCKSLWVCARYHNVAYDEWDIARVPVFHAGAPTRWMWFEPTTVSDCPHERCAVLKIRPATLNKIEQHMSAADSAPFRMLRAQRVGLTCLWLERALSQCAVDVSFAIPREMRLYFDELRVLNTMAEWAMLVPHATWYISTKEPPMPVGQFVFPFTRANV